MTHDPRDPGRRRSYASLIGLTVAGSKSHKGMSSLATDLDVYAKSSIA